LSKILAWLTEKVDEQDLRNLIVGIFSEVGTKSSKIIVFYSTVQVALTETVDRFDLVIFILLLRQCNPLYSFPLYVDSH